MGDGGSGLLVYAICKIQLKSKTRQFKNDFLPFCVFMSQEQLLVMEQKQICKRFSIYEFDLRPEEAALY